jgi:hypothetical protein
VSSDVAMATRLWSSSTVIRSPASVSKSGTAATELRETLRGRSARSSPHYIQAATWKPTKQTLSDFTREWLAAIEPTIRPSTHYSYSRNLQLHVLPQLGSVQLRRIDAGMLNTLYASLLAEGRKNYAGGGLSPRSVR